MNPIVLTMLCIAAFIALNAFLIRANMILTANRDRLDALAPGPAAAALEAPAQPVAA